jgi:hypothetical protein
LIPAWLAGSVPSLQLGYADPAQTSLAFSVLGNDSSPQPQTVSLVALQRPAFGYGGSTSVAVPFAVIPGYPSWLTVQPSSGVTSDPDTRC